MPLLQYLEHFEIVGSLTIRWLSILFNIYAIVSTGASFLVVSTGLSDFIAGFSETIFLNVSTSKKQISLNVISFSVILFGMCAFPHIFDFLIDRIIIPVMAFQSLLILLMYWNSRSPHTVRSLEDAPKSYNSIERIPKELGENLEEGSIGFSRSVMTIVLTATSIVLAGTMVLGFSKSFMSK